MIPSKRRTIPWTSLIAALALTLPDAAAQASRPGGGAWTTPSCRRIVGTGAVTYTFDEGATLVPTARRLQGTVYTRGLVALDTPNRLLAVVNRTLLGSSDAGCRWSSLGTIDSVSDGFPLSLAAAPGGRAYAWAENREDLARIDSQTVAYLLSPTSAIVGLAADPRDGAHVRLGGSDGSLWDSTDGGVTWTRIGRPPGGGSLAFAYRTVFDPQDFDHVLIGAAVDGAFVSFDAGATWSPAIGFSSGKGGANVFNLVVSPADGRVVWAMGLDFAEYDAGAPSEGKHIYLSNDGGISFTPVVEKSASVTLVNGPLMAAHPTDPAVLYFVFGTSFQAYGTDLFRYDAATGTLAKTHNGYDGIDAIAFSPADAGLIYLGLAEESVSFGRMMREGGSR